MLYRCEIGNCGIGPLSDGAVHQSSWEKIWRKYSFQTEERTNRNKNVQPTPYSSSKRGYKNNTSKK